jgi:hypothetical protein
MSPLRVDLTIKIMDHIISLLRFVDTTARGRFSRQAHPHGKVYDYFILLLGCFTYGLHD